MTMNETEITLRSNTPRTDLKHTEHLLKKEMAEMMISIQYDRARGETPNAWNDRYAEYARVVRAIMKAKGRESYIKVRDYTFYPSDHHKLEDMKFEGYRDVISIVQSLHDTARVPEVL